MILQARDLAVGYRDRRSTRLVVRGVTVEAAGGRLVCLVGPNGSGKSTLLRTLTGMQPALEGSVHLKGHELSSLAPSERARRLAVVLTERVSVGYLSARDVVALGRHPHTDWRGVLSGHDERVVDSVMEETGTGHLADRHFVELSDGERQKVMIARALAQRTPVIVLDEPTAYLDVGGRVEILALLQRLAHEGDRAVVVSTHDLDLALKTADVLWVLVPRGGTQARDTAAPESAASETAASGQAVLSEGAPEDLVLRSVLDCAFSTPRVQFHGDSGSFVIRREPVGRVRLLGEGIRRDWTERALERVGYVVDGASGAGADLVAEVRVTETGWILVKAASGPTILGSIGELVEALRPRGTAA